MKFPALAVVFGVVKMAAGFPSSPAASQCIRMDGMRLASLGIIPRRTAIFMVRALAVLAPLPVLADCSAGSPAGKACSILGR